MDKNRVVSAASTVTPGTVSADGTVRHIDAKSVAVTPSAVASVTMSGMAVIAKAEISGGGSGHDIQPYSGPYEVTPTEEDQVLRTAGKTPDGNIVVKKIPSNYGKITWNGSFMTVS